MKNNQEHLSIQTSNPKEWQIYIQTYIHLWNLNLKEVRNTYLKDLDSDLMKKMMNSSWPAKVSLKNTHREILKNK